MVVSPRQQAQPETTAVELEGPAAGQGLFGSLAIAGAAASLFFCYGQVLISLMAPLFGLAEFELNIHVQAVFMWVFALVTVAGLWRDRSRHGSNVPLAVSGVAVATIIGTLYAYYDIRILILGYVLLVISALLNQMFMLAGLNRKISAQKMQLATLNSSLERRVETQVAEIDRLARLKRFLSSEVADLITSEGRENLLDSHRRQVACLFCDVRSFTAFSETAEPEEVMEVLQAIHERMGELVNDHGGTIGYRAGDGLMVIFNDPLACDDPVEKAVRLAADMKRAFAEVQSRWRERGHELGLGVGVSYGYATLGVIGSEGRYDYTAIGNVVNVAARLCDMAKDGEVLLDRRAQVELGGDVAVDPMGEVMLKGASRGIEVFRLAGDQAMKSLPK